MSRSKDKIKLSPKLQLGVRRTYTKGQLLKIGSGLFLLGAFILTIHTGVVIYRSQTKTPEVKTDPQVLGTSDNQNKIPFTEYKVKKGDTLYSVAQEHNVDWAALATLNNIQTPFTLQTGQTLKIPQP